MALRPGLVVTQLARTRALQSVETADWTSPRIHLALDRLFCASATNTTSIE
jgi:hypothetical protein